MNLLQLITIYFLLVCISAAPLNLKGNREVRTLGFLNYIEPELDNYIDNSDYLPVGMNVNDISRSIPPRKSIGPYNSPIYYIRLPPQPYMFVPGFGYVSQNAPSSVSQLVNLPMPFVANGKPSNIYQWSGSFQSFPTPSQPANSFPSFPSPSSPPIYTPPVKKPLTDSAIQKIPGKFTFNGKPEEILVLRDSYNSLYTDILQNVYP